MISLESTFTFDLVWYLGTMNSDNAKFIHVCELFEELNKVTTSATSKRTHLEGDTGSSLYLTKESKNQIHSTISNWFTQFNSGSILSIFRLLVPEVREYAHLVFMTSFVGGCGESLLLKGKEIVSVACFSFRFRKFFKI